MKVCMFPPFFQPVLLLSSKDKRWATQDASMMQPIMAPHALLPPSDLFHAICSTRSTRSKSAAPQMLVHKGCRIKHLMQGPQDVAHSLLHITAWSHTYGDANTLIQTPLPSAPANILTPPTSLVFVCNKSLVLIRA